jgi:hypothetical protein
LRLAGIFARQPWNAASVITRGGFSPPISSDSQPSASFIAAFCQ